MRYLIDLVRAIPWFATYVRVTFVGFGLLMIWDGMTIGDWTGNVPKVVFNTLVAVNVIVFPFGVVFPDRQKALNDLVLNRDRADRPASPGSGL